ncbi:hypothetical protein BJ508DRAFT_155247 [Ascobolus immersus RN42]|uniref:Uncharacterized protein n=1 Tax=Ascobolus immersus RN42 TaxID=1160509 RepID=A0A3N4HZC2_ASCIM|nr:hypothetical protein BJ508DRAFT_155247 [Ascobolus immersus RN42]
MSFYSRLSLHSIHQLFSLIRSKTVMVKSEMAINAKIEAPPEESIIFLHHERRRIADLYSFNRSLYTTLFLNPISHAMMKESAWAASSHILTLFEINHSVANGKLDDCLSTGTEKALVLKNRIVSLLTRSAENLLDCLKLYDMEYPQADEIFLRFLESLCQESTTVGGVWNDETRTFADSCLIQRQLQERKVVLGNGERKRSLEGIVTTLKAIEDDLMGMVVDIEEFESPWY